MKKSQPNLVSIVVPVYNAAPFLDAMITTVKNQTYSGWELIFIDDGSTDNSAAIIKKYQEDDKRIRLLATKTNSGAAIARNAGIKEATGRYLAFLDADDLWHPEKLGKQLAIMQEQGSVFSFTGYEFARENGTPNGKSVLVPQKLSYREALKRSAISTITVMIDLETIDRNDVLMPDYSMGEDAATWWSLLRKYGDAHGLPEVLAYYRRHGEGSLSSNKVKAAAWRWKLYRRHEHLSLIQSMYYFYHYAVYAVSRRV